MNITNPAIQMTGPNLRTLTLRLYKTTPERPPQTKPDAPGAPSIWNTIQPRPEK
jgi:hypothetical protein